MATSFSFQKSAKTPPKPADAGDYKVGYRKPPKHTQFQKGVSGNPKGKKKGAKNVATIFEKALGEKVVVKKADGTEEKMTKAEAMVALLFMKALKGDPKAMKIIWDASQKLEDKQPEEAVPDIAAEDLALLKDHAQLLELLKGFPDEV